MSCKNAMDKSKIKAVDLFCGAGGLTCGLQQAGVDVVAGVDIEEYCRYPFEHNNKSLFICKSVKDLKYQEIKSFFSPACFSLLAGCAPCQTFSTYNRKSKPSDPRWALLNEFLRLVKEIKPDFVTMENVPQLAEKEIFRNFLVEIEKCGYTSNWRVIHCEIYGLPQHRHRLILIASRFGKVPILDENRFGAQKRTVRDAIYKLPKIQAGGSLNRDPLHFSSKLSELNMKRIKLSIPGGTWRDWPKSVRAECHLKESGKTFPSVYGRMEWDDVAPTITTQFNGYGNGRFGHPEQDRAISLREGAILQSFPLNYEFVKKGDKIKIAKIARLIGNAVPVVIGKLIGKSIQNFIEMELRK